MTTLDELKMKRMAELQQQQFQPNAQMQQEMAFQQQVAELEGFVKQYLSKEALERFGNLKVAHPETTVQLTVVLARLIQAGRVKEVGDSQLRELLLQLTPQKRDIKIVRK